MIVRRGFEDFALLSSALTSSSACLMGLADGSRSEPEVGVDVDVHQLEQAILLASHYIMWRSCVCF